MSNNVVCMYDVTGTYACKRTAYGAADLYDPKKDYGLEYNVPFLSRSNGGETMSRNSMFSGRHSLSPASIDECFAVHSPQHR